MDLHPNPEQLRLWLEGRLNDADSEEIAAHVTTCAAICQTTLDRISAGKAPSPDREPSRVDSVTPGAPDAITPTAARVRIRCPHCQAPLHLGDAGSDEVLCPGCGSSFQLRDARHTESSTPQKTLGRFQLLERVGMGGFGAVWRARDTSLDRIVALKIPHAGLLTEGEQLERFQREARAVAQLRHPGIVSVHEVTVLNGLPAIVAEFAPGASLRDFLEVRRPTFRQTAALVAEVAEALDYAHSLGVVHRDLKPGNIMLVRDLPPGDETGAAPAGELGELGRPLLLDFGLALRDAAEVTLTMDGHILGTPAYMSPEQAAGKSHQADRRSDVYSLGVVLYELLTGELPFRGSRLMMLQQVLRDEPRPPRKCNHQIPRDLETICLKALAKSPQGRYATAREMADDLRRFLTGEPITARPIGRLERGWRWCRRNPGLAASLMAAAALLGVTVVSAVLAAFQFRAKADVEAKARGDLERQLYISNIAVAERELSLNQDVGLASTLLEKCPASLRGWEWHYLMRLRDGPRAPLRGHQKGLWTAVFSPNGRHIATASIDGTVKVWDAATGREVRAFPRGLPVMCLAYSPDGKQLATGSLAPNLFDLRQSRGVVKVWDADTGRLAATVTRYTGFVYSLAFSPDGRHLAYAVTNDDRMFVVCDAHTLKDVRVFRGNASHVHRVRYSPDGRLLLVAFTDGSIRFWDGAALEPLRSIVAHSALVYDLAFSPDGSRFASTGFDGTVGVWTTATGALVRRLRGHTGMATGIAFSPDGTRIASAGYDKTVRLWDAATFEEKITLRGHDDTVCSVAFSPDGKLVLSASFDKEARLWDAAPLQQPTGPGLFTIVGHKDRVNVVAFSPDGRVLASGSWDTSVRLWDARTGAELRTLTGHKGAVWGVSFSPDGQRLASASWDRTVKIWDVATGRELRVFTGHGTPVNGVAFSPDGKRIASAGFEGIVKVWEAGTGKEIAAYTGNLFPALAVAFSPDGQRVASGSGDGTVTVWQAVSGRTSFILKGHRGLVRGVAFSPDGRYLASASWDRTAKIWDAASKKELLTLSGHTDRVQSVAFSPDGSRIATASEDKTVRVWDATTGREVLPACRHHGVVLSVTFSPDGKRLATGCWSPAGWVRTWDAEGK